jgi:tight adherence protein C
VTALLAATAVLLVFAAIWELWGSASERLGAAARAALASLSGGRADSLDEAAQRLRLPERIARAGLAGSVAPRTVVAAKLAGATAGGGLALAAAPAVTPRLALVVTALLIAAGFFGPDAWLERAARRRRARFVAALPDALDMLAVGAASGRSPATVFGEVAGGTSGPLAVELGAAVAQIECGTPARTAIAALRRRIPGGELGALAAALERSQSYGSPLAEQLHLQATTLRLDARRRISDHAARAAPKIQLVVALVLVPSVLLTIVSAIIAHSGALFGQF